MYTPFIPQILFVYTFLYKVVATPITFVDLIDYRLELFKYARLQ
jgi:hypothetical protein